MEQKYDENWEKIMADLSDMSEIAEDMLQNAIKSLDNKDIELAKKVISKDDVLDNYQIIIEEKVSRILAMDQSLVSDVWNNISVVKIAGDLERIGDLANDIAEAVLELKNEDDLQPLVMIPELAETVSEMLDTVLEAFITKNEDLAEAVCRKDEEADNIYEQIYKSTLKLINNNDKKRNIKQIIKYLHVAKSLERIGDHATNIGEETIYTITGKRVKY